MDEITKKTSHRKTLNGCLICLSSWRHALDARVRFKSTCLDFQIPLHFTKLQISTCCILFVGILRATVVRCFPQNPWSKWLLCCPAYPDHFPCIRFSSFDGCQGACWDQQVEKLEHPEKRHLPNIMFQNRNCQIPFHSLAQSRHPLNSHRHQFSKFSILKNHRTILLTLILYIHLVPLLSIFCKQVKNFL